MTNLSTSSSKSKLSNRRKPWYSSSWDILGAVAIVALLELGLHVAVDEFKLAGLDRVESEQGLTMRADFIDAAIKTAEATDAINVAVIGSSIADGINTAQLSEQLDESPVEYFKLVGADSRGTALLLEDIVLPNLQVNWVVYMVSPHDANALSPVEERNLSIPGIDSYAENRAVYKLSRKIENNLYLFRFRSDIVKALPSLSSVRRLLSGQSSSDSATNKPYKYATYTAFKEAARFQGDLEHIYQLCQENNARLAILAIPTNPAADITSKQFQQGADVWLSSIKSFAEKRNVIVVNGFKTMTKPSHYRDTHHLSKEGIDIVTKDLSEAIQSAPPD